VAEHFLSSCPRCGYPLDLSSPSPTDELECVTCGESIDLEQEEAGVGRSRFSGFSLVAGFNSLFAAVPLLARRDEYRGTLARAVAANLTLVLIFFIGVVWGFHTLIGSFDWLSTWSWVESAVLLLSWPLSLLVAWFLAPILINLGLSPFLDPIAAVTERIVAGEQMRSVNIGLLRGLQASLNAAIQVLILQVFVLIPILLLALIPLIGVFFAGLGMLFSAYLNALVWFEIPVVRRGYGWRYRRKVVRKNWPFALGFGLAFNLGLLIPFFNLFVLGPAAAIATSKLYFQFDKRIS